MVDAVTMRLLFQQRYPNLTKNSKKKKMKTNKKENFLKTERTAGGTKRHVRAAPSHNTRSGRREQAMDANATLEFVGKIWDTSVVRLPARPPALVEAIPPSFSFSL